MQAVNLLPAYARPGHPWGAVGKDLSPRRVVKAGSVVALVAVLGLGFGFVHARSVVNDKRAELADVQAEVAVADSKAAPLRATQAAAAARMAVAGTASSKRIAWEQLLADLSRVLPNHVYLQNLSLQSPTPVAAGASAAAAPTTPPGATPAPSSASSFSVTGVASSHVKVAVVLDRLPSLPWLSNVTLLSSTNGGASGSTLSRGDTFSVSATLNPTGGAK